MKRISSRLRYLVWFTVFAGLLASCAQGPESNPSSAAPPGRITAPFVPGEVIVKFKPGVTAQSLGASLERLRPLPLRNVGLYRVTPSLRAQDGDLEQATVQLVAQLSARDDVLYAVPNYLLNAAATPNDPLYSRQWHYRAINLPAAWEQTTGSANVTVAVIDSGVVTTHPDLADKLVPGYDFVSSTANSGDGDGRDGDPTDPAGNFHGLHVAGTVAAQTNDGRGVAGVSWGARILPVRVLGSSSGTLADAIDGVLWSVGKSVAGVPTNPNPAQVLNLSLGGPFLCRNVQPFQEAFDQATATGAVVVVAAGNNSDDATSYAPASCNNVIAVGATTLETKRAYYSNYGGSVDVMAPGGDLRSGVDADADGQPDGVLSSVQGGYAYFSGTSMASPHVAGVVALLKSVQPSLTYARALDILKRSARPITDSSCSVGCGAGLIDAAAALKLLASPAPAPTPTPTPAPTPMLATYTVNFDSPVPVGRVITDVSLGRGVASSTGTNEAAIGITDVSLGRGVASSTGTNETAIGVTAKRAGKSGNVAMITGSARQFIISNDGKSQSSYAKGGELNFKLSTFGSGTFKTLEIKGTTTTGGTVKVYQDDRLLKRISVPKTGGRGSKTLTLNAADATRVTVTLKGPGAVDDLVFTAPQ